MSSAWMPLYIADYRADTAHLSAAQHGAYLLLIMHYWQHGCLPEDEKQIARIACLTPGEWRKHRDVLQAFFHDGWRHKRIDAERGRTGAIIEKRRSAAQQMHQRRRSKPDANAGAHADANHGANGVHSTVQTASKTDASLVYPQPHRDSTSKDSALHPRGSDGRHISSGDLIERLVKAAEGNVRHQTEGIEIIKPILDLIGQGCDLEKDILPTIAEIVPGLDAPLKTWAARFLREAILGRRNARLNGRGPNAAYVSPPKPDYDLLRNAVRQGLQTIPDGYGDPLTWPDEVKAWPEMRPFVEAVTP